MIFPAAGIDFQIRYFSCVALPTSAVTIDELLRMNAADDRQHLFGLNTFLFNSPSLDCVADGYIYSLTHHHLSSEITLTDCNSHELCDTSSCVKMI